MVPDVSLKICRRNHRYSSVYVYIVSVVSRVPILVPVLVCPKISRHHSDFPDISDIPTGTYFVDRLY